MSDDETPETGEDDRRQGVEFGDLEDALASHDYPATTDELLEAYGDYTVGLPDGEERFRDVLAGYDEEFEDAQAVEDAVMNMVGSEAVGREGYTDRGSNVPGTEDGEDEKSV